MFAGAGATLLLLHYTTGAVAAGVMCLWPSTAASIPSGWTRETTLDAKYPKGTAAAIDPGGTGGALTHTHTTQNHNHSAAHTHTVPNSPDGSGSTNRDVGLAFPIPAHTHVSNSSTANPTASLANANPGTGSDNNEPAFFAVIFIKSNGTPNGIPNNAVVLWNDSTGAPTSWNLADGAAGRPDMRSRFLKGAATAGDGGGTGGAATHSHTVASHDHGGNFSHDHPTVTSSTTASLLSADQGSGGQASCANSNHTHALTIGTQGTAAITGNTDPTGTGANEPPYIAQAFVQNNTGGESLPSKVICLWLGTLASIPSGWVICDGSNDTPDLRSSFIKGAATLGGIGATGGSTTHTDTATGHTHAVASHAQTVTAGASGLNTNVTAGAVATATAAHTHAAWSNTGASSFTSGTGTPTVDNFTTTEPPYVTVAYIQRQPVVIPGKPTIVLQAVSRAASW